MILICQQIGQTVSFVVASTSLSRQSLKNAWLHFRELGSKRCPRQTLQPGDCTLFAESTTMVLLVHFDDWQSQFQKLTDEFQIHSACTGPGYAP